MKTEETEAVAMLEISGSLTKKHDDFSVKKAKKRPEFPPFTIY